MYEDIKLGTFDRKAKRSIQDIILGTFFAVLVMLTTSAAATQILARELRYPLYFGDPIMWTDNKPLYSPHLAWYWLPKMIWNDVPVYIPVLLLIGGVLVSGLFLYLGFRRKSKRIWFYVS